MGVKRLASSGLVFPHLYDLEVTTWLGLATANVHGSDMWTAV